jgi:CheY-like chemotaxis protein
MNDLNRLSALVGGLGFVPQNAGSGSEGLMKARQFPVEDLVVVDARDAQLNLMVDAFGNKIDAEFAGQTVRSFVKEMKDDLYTRTAPIIFVVADEDQEIQYKNDDFFKDKVAAFIRWGSNEPIAEEYFADVVNKVIKEIELKEKNKVEAFRMAADAAVALGRIDVDKGALGQYVKDAVPALIVAIETCEDPIRVPGLEALGLFREQEAIQAIVRVLNHPRSSKEARLAAIRALGRINPSDSAAYQALKAVLADADFDIRCETGVALGHVTLDSRRLLEIMEQQRIEKGIKER